MKIRQGFVSNSSSSSFLIRTDGEYKTVYDVAKAMLLDLQQKYSDTSYNIELKNLEKYKDTDTPVQFNMSDGGYIRKFKDYIIVGSSMHYDSSIFDENIISFYDIEKNYFSDLKYESYGEKLEFDHHEDFDYYYNQFDDYLMLQYGIFGMPAYNFKDKCSCGSYNTIKIKNGKTICVCKINKHIRKEKLKEIENEN